MNIILKHIDVDGCEVLENYRPEIDENFLINVNLRIGPTDQDGAHDYILTVCSVRRLSHIIDKEGSVCGRHMLILNRFDANEIRGFIDKVIRKSDRSNFEESSNILARFFAWEYEDYQM